MQSFEKHYFNEGIPEISWNMFANIFRKTKKVPVQSTWLGELTEINEQTYKNIARKMTSLYSKGSSKVAKKDKKLRVTEFMRGYVTSGLPLTGKGSIQKKLGKNISFRGKGVDTPNIPVYKFSNGGIIVLLDLGKKESDERTYAIAGNWRGRQAVEQIEAMTFKDFIHSSEPFITTRTKSLAKSKERLEEPKVKSTKKITKSTKPSDRYSVTYDLSDEDSEDTDDIYQVRFREPEADREKVAVTYKDKESGKEKLTGLVDIPYDTYDMLIKTWGDGKKGGLVPGAEYNFVGRFTRSRFSNETGSGYKYTDGDHSVYLLDIKGDDDTWALMAFDGKESYKWAVRIGMLDFWTVKGKKSNQIDWKMLNMEDLPEGVQND